jgi:hypothetical protein
MNAPAMAATLLMPRPSPRWWAGKASVMMAEELAKSIAPPTPWPILMPISQTAAAGPCIHVTESRIEKTVKTANPRLYIFTRPNMSPTRPSVTNKTARTTMNPIRIHNMYPVFEGVSGFRWMPRKMAGRAISTIDWLMNTMSVPRVMFDRAIHL